MTIFAGALAANEAAEIWLFSHQWEWPIYSVTDRVGGLYFVPALFFFPVVFFAARRGADGLATLALALFVAYALRATCRGLWGWSGLVDEWRSTTTPWLRPLLLVIALGLAGGWASRWRRPTPVKYDHTAALLALVAAILAAGVSTWMLLRFPPDTNALLNRPVAVWPMIVGFALTYCVARSVADA